ncbi:MAG: hypothetical protein R3236_09070, partial [Phycisphaeraceae bacterium]|nr:hypothetical protein [Phycisphaeraceae bacterium]
MNRWVLSLLMVGVFGVAAAAEPARSQKSPPKVTEEKPTRDFHGFKQVQFKLDGVDCRLVYPRRAAAGNPWIWRARFFGHQPQADVALLKRGFHVAYTNVAGLFGSPEAVRRWDRFYQYLTAQKGFAAKPALEGMSRGGLIIYNWAIRNSTKVACLYGDAPVCDFKSWPGGFGKGKGSKGDWARCLKAYGLKSDAEAKAYQGNPVDNLKPLA